MIWVVGKLQELLVEIFVLCVFPWVMVLNQDGDHYTKSHRTFCKRKVCTIAIGSLFGIVSYVHMFNKGIVSLCYYTLASCG
jgi:hypothetical protein